MKWNRHWIATILICALASTAMAREGALKTKDNRTLEGDIDETLSKDTVTITMHGVQTTIDRAQIDSIEYPVSFQEQFKQRMDAAPKGDAAALLDIARWAFEQREYAAARQAAAAAQTVQPDNAAAADLLALIQRQVALESHHTGEVVPPPPATTGTAAPPAQPVDHRFLTADDINVIRQMELRSDSLDAGTLIEFSHDVKKRYLGDADKPAIAKFNALSAAQQAVRIIRDGDPRLLPDVQLRTDPVSLSEYHRLQPMLLTGCANAGCHNGPSGGDFILYNPSETTPAWYTDFFILQTYTRHVEPKVMFNGSGPVVARMIDRAHPTASLLIQYGLPLELADTPHPNVPNFKPLFRNKDDANCKKLTSWMTGVLSPVQPEYGIRFDAPGAKYAKTQPVTQPTTQPAPAAATSPAAPTTTTAPAVRPPKTQ